MKSLRILLVCGASVLLLASVSCTGDKGADGTDGDDGDDGVSCTVTDNGDGTRTISCDDGTEVTVDDGEDGTSCTVVDNGDGTKTITCDDGTTVIVGDGDDGRPGLEEGQTPGIGATVTASAPANGTHFVAGEQIVITITVLDGFGYPLVMDDLSTARLYMNGPRDVLKTESAVELLNANEDRSISEHHYINLATTTNPNLVVDGNQFVYTTEAVTTEAAGTYTIGFRGRSEEFRGDRVFELLDVQIGTATEEPLITGNCVDCHKGAMSGMTYLHHIDRGSYEIDGDPVRTCKMCHNQDGYSTVRVCDDGSKAVRISGTYTCADGSEDWSYMNDPIIRRVHGVHMGEKLLSDFNINPDWGDFGDYLDVIFPANVKNCTKCHTDDSWQNKPSRLACGACHDNLDFTTGTFVPPKVTGDGTCTADGDCDGVFSGFDGVCNTGTGNCELQTHTGGTATDDTGCDTCHVTGGMADIAVVHDVPAHTFAYDVALTMTAPGNGTHYVAGEAPVITIVVSDTGGSPIDHTTITEASGNFNRVNLFVNGPRAERKPALTTTARAETTSAAAGPWDLDAATDFQLKVGTKSLVLTPPSNPAATAADVVTWLNGDASFSSVAFATTDGTDVTILCRPSTTRATLEILASDVTTEMSWTVGVYDAETSSYASNVFWQYTDPSSNDPKVSWSAANVTYQLDDVATAEPGTYSVWVEIGSYSALPVSWGLINFQVGTATAEPKVATNCTDCHEDERMHAGYFAINFDADICGSCHDYKRQYPDRTTSDPLDGWGGNAASGRSNAGFGAAPIARRIHGVHYGRYLDKPEEVHGSYDYSGLIFPQDVRNCTKCHSDSDTWMQKPSRLVCLACHDGDAAIAHGTLMTVDPTPEDPWNGDEMESCATCHGPDRDFAPAVVHNIWDPYVGPYPRNPE